MVGILLVHLLFQSFSEVFAVSFRTFHKPFGDAECQRNSFRVDAKPFWMLSPILSEADGGEKRIFGKGVTR